MFLTLVLLDTCPTFITSRYKRCKHVYVNLTPKMVDNTKWANFTEKSSHCFVTLLSSSYSSCPAEKRLGTQYSLDVMMGTLIFQSNFCCYLLVMFPQNVYAFVGHEFTFSWCRSYKNSNNWGTLCMDLFKTMIINTQKLIKATCFIWPFWGNTFVIISNTYMTALKSYILRDAQHKRNVDRIDHAIKILMPCWEDVCFSHTCAKYWAENSKEKITFKVTQKLIGMLL